MQKNMVNFVKTLGKSLLKKIKSMVNSRRKLGKYCQVGCFATWPLMTNWWGFFDTLSPSICKTLSICVDSYSLISLGAFALQSQKKKSKIKYEIW